MHLPHSDFNPIYCVVKNKRQHILKCINDAKIKRFNDLETQEEKNGKWAGKNKLFKKV